MGQSSSALALSSLFLIVLSFVLFATAELPLNLSVVGWDGDGWKLIVNPIVGTPLAGPDWRFGPGFAPAITATRAIGSWFDVGFEYYADFGPLSRPSPVRDELHYVFEVVDLLAVEHLEVNVGIGEGLTPASDPVIVKAIVGYEFDLSVAHSKESATRRILPRRL